MRDLSVIWLEIEEVEVTQPEREGGPGEDGRQLHPTLAGVMALDVRAVGLLVVDLELFRVGHDVTGSRPSRSRRSAA